MDRVGVIGGRNVRTQWKRQTLGQRVSALKDKHQKTDWLLGADFEHLGAADRAYSGCRRLAVLHRRLLWVLHFLLCLAFYAVGLHSPIHLLHNIAMSVTPSLTPAHVLARFLCGYFTHRLRDFLLLLRSRVQKITLGGQESPS